MNALVVYESMWGNTEQVARAVGRGLSEQGIHTEVVEVDKAPAVLDGVDLLVVGGPTHAFSMSRESSRAEAVQRGAPGTHTTGIREWLDSLGPSDVSVATFDSRVEKVRRLPGSAAKAAAKQARRHHVGTVVAEESFYVEDMAGPLVEGELARAEEWAEDLARVSW